MSQTLLLDTCAAMFLLANEPMAKAANEAIDKSVDASAPLYVSPITAWEVGMLSRKGWYRSSFSPQRWLARLRALPGIRICELTSDILMVSSFLPGSFHKDPADRIIAATAREFGHTVMTRDKALLDYGSEGHLSVLEC